MARFFSLAFVSSLLFIPATGLALDACGGSTASTHDAGGSGRDSGTVPEPDAATGLGDSGDTTTDAGIPGHDAMTGKRDAESPPEAYVSSTLGAGATGSCNIDEPADTPFLTVGTESAPATDGTGGVSVACQVQATSATSYEVNGQISDGSLGGFVFSGVLSDTAGAQAGITAEFSSGVDSYDETDCTFTLTTQVAMPIASGRVWGTLSCPMLVDPEANVTCAGSAEVTLQNCAE